MELSTDNRVPLCTAFNRAITCLANENMPNGWRVMPNAPYDLPALVQYYNTNGCIAVELTGSGGCTMGIPEQHYAFRAWHDLLHVQHCGDFDIPGETEMARKHQQAVYDRFGFNACTQWFAALIEIEIVAQNEVNVRKGSYPADPRAFALCWLAEREIVKPVRSLERMLASV